MEKHEQLNKTKLMSVLLAFSLPTYRKSTKSQKLVINFHCFIHVVIHVLYANIWTRVLCFIYSSFITHLYFCIHICDTLDLLENTFYTTQV